MGSNRKGEMEANGGEGGGDKRRNNGLWRVRLNIKRWKMELMVKERK